MADKLEPLGDRVVIKPIIKDEVTKSGIVLPDTATKEQPQEGEIIAVGPGKLLDSGERGKMSVKKNDVVVYGKYSGSDVEVDGTEYKILRESEILGVLEK